MGLARNFAARGGALILLLGAGLTLAGCSTTGDGGSQAMAMLPEASQVTPVNNSTVATNNLPPIGADGSVQVANTADPGAMPGTPATNPTTDPMQTASVANPSAPGSDSSFVSLNDINTTTTGTGRDLSGGLTVEKLLGGWTVTSGSTSCRLNLTFTQKTGTDRYRASSPDCAIPALGSVASWQLVGGQIQLFNESGKLIANLLQSGGRFIGALTGGQGISMAG